ncbi:MAG TPA: pilus assembly protein, partial [Microlunatus sp.]
MTITHRAHNERGGSQSVAAILVGPVVLFAILAVFQASVWYSGRQATLSAAQAAAEAERVLHPAGGAGQAAASSIASQRGLDDVSVSVSRGVETVTVVVSARVPMFVDIGVGRFNEQASMAR